MQKTILIARQELLTKLLDDINTSGVPLYVVEPMLEKLCSEVSNQVQRQYIAEKKQYDEDQQNQKKEG